MNRRTPLIFASLLGAAGGCLSDDTQVADTEQDLGIVLPSTRAVVGLAAINDGDFHAYPLMQSGSVMSLDYQTDPAAPHGAGDVLDHVGTPSAIAAYSTPDGMKHVIVAEKGGAIKEIFFNGATHGVGQIGTAMNVVAITGYYAANDDYQHVFYVTADGQLSEIYWRPGAGLYTASNFTSWTGANALASTFNPAEKQQHLIVNCQYGIFDMEMDKAVPGQTPTAVTNFLRKFDGIVALAAVPGSSMNWLVAGSSSGLLRDISWQLGGKAGIRDGFVSPQLPGSLTPRALAAVRKDDWAPLHVIASTTDHVVREVEYGPPVDDDIETRELARLGGQVLSPIDYGCLPGGARYQWIKSFATNLPNNIGTAPANVTFQWQIGRSFSTAGTSQVAFDGGARPMTFAAGETLKQDAAGFLYSGRAYEQHSLRLETACGAQTRFFLLDIREPQQPVPTAPVITKFTLAPDYVRYGNSMTAEWSVTPGVACGNLEVSIIGRHAAIFNVDKTINLTFPHLLASGSVIATPPDTTDFELTARCAGSNLTAKATKRGSVFFDDPPPTPTSTSTVVCFKIQNPSSGCTTIAGVWYGDPDAALTWVKEHNDQAAVVTQLSECTDFSLANACQ